MMELPLQVSFHGLPHSDAVAEYIKKKAEKLDTFHDRITSCRVAIESPHRHQHEGRPYRVRIDIGVPGSELVVSRDVGEPSHADPYAAIDAAFDDAQRKLKDHGRMQRGDVKHHEEQGAHGLVTKLFSYEGYGFITTREGEEIYFHKNSVLNGAFDRMQRGARVRYVTDTGDDGVHASSVTLLPGRGVALS